MYRVMSLMRVSVLFLLLLPTLLVGQDAELKAQMDKYVGQWNGYFMLEAPDIEYTENFSVEQRYWWQGDILRGVSVSRREDGMLTSRSASYVKDGQIISEISRGEDVEHFYGVLLDGGIVWIPADMSRAEHYQMKEVIEVKEGQSVMLTTGFDTFVHKDKPSYLLYRGELVLEKDAQ